MIIRAENLIKSFPSAGGDFIVLKNLSLTVKEGEFVAIIGRSGSGKSTLLYQLSLLDRPTGGEIYFEEQQTSRLPSEARTKIRLTRMGYIFQDYALIPTLTALENVRVPLLMQNKSDDVSVRMAIDALEKVGLGDKLNNLPSQLSGGQQQRVSIARSIAHKPTVLFADEPTANLDSESSRQVLDVFRSLHKEGQTILMVTHEEEYAKETERIVMLSDGIIVREDVLQKHRSNRVPRKK